MSTPFKSGQKIKATGNISGCCGLTQNKEYVVKACFHSPIMNNFMVSIINDNGNISDYVAHRFSPIDKNTFKFKVGDTILVKYYTGYWQYKVLAIADEGNAVKTDKNDWMNIGPDSQYKFIEVVNS